MGVDSSSSFRCPVELVVVVTTTTDREGGIRFSADVDIEVESKQRREKEISGGLVSKWSIRVRPTLLGRLLTSRRRVSFLVGRGQTHGATQLALDGLQGSHNLIRITSHTRRSSSIAHIIRGRCHFSLPFLLLPVLERGPPGTGQGVRKVLSQLINLHLQCLGL